MYKLILLNLLIIIPLSACTLFNNKENASTISSLPVIKQQCTPSIVWSARVGSGIGNFYSKLHPAFSDSVVYAADRNGTICAFNADSGKQIWSANLANKNNWFSRTSMLLSGGITIEDSIIYVGSEKALVYALNSKDGSVIWRTLVAGEALSSPVVSDSMVLIHTSNGQLQALNKKNGEIKWTVKLNTPFFSLRGESTPAVAFGMAIIGDDNGQVNAVWLQQGQIIWKQIISQASGITEINRLNDIDTTPIIIDNRVYVLAYNGHLVALELYDGKIVWKRTLDSANKFIINNNYIYLVDQNDRLLALSSKEGGIIWEQNNLLHRLLTPPVLYNGNLVVGDSKGYLYWIDLKTGHFITKKKVHRSGFLTEPIVAGNKLLIQAKDGTLYAIMC